MRISDWSSDVCSSDLIVHLVLARLPDAPEGVKGISLFLVPKYLPDAEGGFTVRNGMSVGALEKKMGIHAQPTCVMNYDGATGWLVGEPHRGIAAMRSEEHTSELQSLMRNSYAVFCLKKKRTI